MNDEKVVWEWEKPLDNIYQKPIKYRLCGNTIKVNILGNWECHSHLPPVFTNEFTRLATRVRELEEKVKQYENEANAIAQSIAMD